MPCSVCGHKTRRGRSLCYRHGGSGGPSRARAKKAPTIPVAVAASDAQALVLEALSKFEDALFAQAASKGVSDSLEKQFDRYQKLKALALQGVDGEATAAMRLALIDVIKLVF